MLLKVQHQTRYQYDESVVYSIQRLRMTPQSFDGQRVLNWNIEAPGMDQALSYRDGFNNPVQLVTINDEHQEMLISVSGEVETVDANGSVKGLRSRVPNHVWLRRTSLTEPDDAIKQLAAEKSSDDWVTSCHDMMSAIHEQVNYLVGVTDSATTAQQAFAEGEGVCQDHAHIFIAAMRVLGLPSRYVTGYMMVGDPDDDQPMRADANHAWAETLIPDLGWVGFDVANRCSPTERYIRAAHGLDSSHAAPIRGIRRGGGEEAMDVQVVVEQQAQSQQ